MEVMDSRALARYLGTSEWLIRQRTRTGEIPSFRVGGRVLFRKETVDKWISRQEASEKR